MTESQLIEEATSRAGLVWIGVDDGRAEPVWHHWRSGAAYVLTGGIEQPARALAEAVGVNVTVRCRTTGGRVLAWRATVTTVAPGGAEWNEVIPELLIRRRNIPDSRQAQLRWARECTLFRLDPAGGIIVPGARQSQRDLH